MMTMIEIDIYISNLIKFFDNNPEDLINLVPLEMKYKFYEKLKEESYQNYKNGGDVILTQKQISKVVSEINESMFKIKGFQLTKIGLISLN
jgi:pyruvate formate-lyase activating enzyme-like uncharacterized protein